MQNFEQFLPSGYKIVATIHEDHHVFLVQDESKGSFFVYKILDVFDENVFSYVADKPIAHMPKIHRISNRNGHLVIIEDYIQGSTLQQFLDSGRIFSESEVVDIMLYLCETVAELHDSATPIIHRDIKPGNIILTPDNIPWLLDLNAARLDTVAGEEDTQLLGTKGYAAPEQYGFGTSDATTDIYALGMLMNTLLTGKPSRTEIAPGALSEIISCCLSIDRNERFHNIGEFEKALLRTQHGKGIIKKHPLKKGRSAYRFPGFRTGNPWHIIMAVIGYILIFFYSISFDFGEDKASQGAGRFTLFVSLLAVVLFLFNYLEIQNSMSFIPKEKGGTRTIRLAIVGFAVFFAVFILVGIASITLTLLFAS